MNKYVKLASKTCGSNRWINGFISTWHTGLYKDQAKKHAVCGQDGINVPINLSKKVKSIFLSRPRRFGKSFLLSTFKAILSGKKAQFDALAISNSCQQVYYLSLGGEFIRAWMALPQPAKLGWQWL